MCDRRLEPLGELLGANHGDGNLEDLSLVRAGGVVGRDVGRVGPRAQALGAQHQHKVALQAVLRIRDPVLFEPLDLG